MKLLQHELQLSADIPEQQHLQSICFVNGSFSAPTLLL